MTGGRQRPILFLDVDGPLIPFGGQGTHPIYEPVPTGAGINPLVARINPALGPELAALGCEIVWASTWAQDANEAVAPRIGLPELAFVEWPPDDAPLPNGLHWKPRRSSPLHLGLRCGPTLDRRSLSLNPYRGFRLVLLGG
ncbi:hypothetical protein FB561_0923 [Kribbella amoyensis]|uniref:Secreted protein n=1 Tax=Kribbella amoyensis TaxID=996641 RepID=A0A561BM14_9ACTN|nr:hypothetical protein [Kribbella amoyensis]TWD79857.1 hypothetical protein FB561_0923 [Kribbella amoyensis]